jgi:RHS repeat-associated protein
VNALNDPFGTVTWLLGDHLGSTSLSVSESGTTIAEAKYTPVSPKGMLREGKQRNLAGDLPTDYGYTGQREESALGLMYYVARWYDSGIGHFVQADTIVPGAGNPAAWNRYAYVMYNPVKLVDPSGHNPWYIAGWDDSFIQKQEGNTCAVVSMAVALSILYGSKLTQEDVQPLYAHTFAGLGVIPKEQAAMINLDPGIEATFIQGARADIMQNLNDDNPTLITLAFDIDEGVGHVMVVIGYDPSIGEFMIFDPAYGDVKPESEIADRYSFTGSGTQRTFDELWDESNIFIGDHSMVTVKRVSLFDKLDGVPGNGGGSPEGLNHVLR